LPANYEGRYCLDCGTVFAIAAFSLSAKFGHPSALSARHPAGNIDTNNIDTNLWIVFAGVSILLLSQIIFLAFVH